MTYMGVSIASDDIPSIRINACGRKMGIAFTDNSSVIKHNFFDLDYLNWSFSSFRDIDASDDYGTIIDMDFAGYNNEDNGRMAVGWISTDNHYSYVGGLIAADDGSQWATDGTSVIVESSPVNVLASPDYVVNSYRKIAVSLKEADFPMMIACGTESKIFSLGFSSGGKDWGYDIIDMEAPSGAVAFLYLRSEFYGYFDDNPRIVIGLDTGDIYYLKVNLVTETFPLTNPPVVILNEDEPYHATYREGRLNGVDIVGIQNNWVGANLTDADIPLFITIDIFSSSSSSEGESSSSSSLGESPSSSSSSSRDISSSSISSADLPGTSFSTDSSSDSSDTSQPGSSGA